VQGWRQIGVKSRIKKHRRTLTAIFNLHIPKKDSAKSISQISTTNSICYQNFNILLGSILYGIRYSCLAVSIGNSIFPKEIIKFMLVILRRRFIFPVESQGRQMKQY
jgi:hypothetical protein